MQIRNTGIMALILRYKRTGGLVGQH
jgi:hypothetical protein